MRNDSKIVSLRLE